MWAWLTASGALERGVHSRDRPLDLAEHPEHPRHERQHGHAGVLAGDACRHPVGLLAGAEHLDRSLHRLARLDDASQEEQDHRLSAYRVDQRRPVPRASAAFSSGVVASSACDSSPRTTLTVASQNIT